MSVDINGAIADWLTNVFREIGDPDGLREHAEDLQRQAEHVRAVHAQLATDVASSSWSGADYEAFRSAWQEHAKLADDTADGLQATANQVDEHANRTWEIVKEIIGIALEILEVLAAGIILSWLLAGLADIIWARIAPLIERIVQLLERFRTMLGDFTEWARKAGSAAGRIGEEIGRLIGRATEEIVGGFPANARAYGNFCLAQVVAQAMTGRPIDWSAIAWQTAVFFAMDVGNNMILSLLKERIALKSAVKETSARTGRSAESEAGSSGASVVDGAAAETERVVSPGGLFDDARVGARSEGASVEEANVSAARTVRRREESADSHPAASGAGDTHAAMEIRAVRLESEGVRGEQRATAWTEADRPVGSTHGPADGAAVRSAAGRSPGETSGSGARRSSRSTSASGESEILPSSNANVTGTVRTVRTGGDDEFLAYRGPDISKSFRSEGVPKTFSEAPVVKVPSSAEAGFGSSARNVVREADAAPAARSANASETSLPEQLRVETSFPAQAQPAVPARGVTHEVDAAPATRPASPSETFPSQQPRIETPRPDLASPPPPHMAESPAAARTTEFDAVSLTNVDRDAANIDRILTSPAGSRATREFEIPPQKLPETHKAFEPKSWKDSILAGIQEGLLTALGNFQTTLIVNHIQNADQTIDGKLVLNLFIGGAIAGTRQLIWGISPIGERYAYREIPPNSPTLLRNLLSESTMQAAFYTSHMIIKMPIVNGVSGQITPTEISQHDNQ